MNRNQPYQHGFTLIELMIVVAILGILSSIAVVQFGEFRMKAFNGASLSAVRSFELAEAGFYSEYFQYAPISISDQTNGSINKNITLTGGGSASFVLNLSNEVKAVCKTATGPASAVIVGKHDGGDRLIGVDTDIPGKKYSLKSGPATDADAPASTSGNDLPSWSDL